MPPLLRATVNFIIVVPFSDGKATPNFLEMQAYFAQSAPSLTILVLHLFALIPLDYNDKICNKLVFIGYNI